MADNKPEFRKEILEGMRKKIGMFDSFGRILFAYCGSPYSRDAFNDLWQAMVKQSGKRPDTYESVDELLNRQMLHSLKSMLGKPFIEEVRELIQLRMQGQYSTSLYRRSYRSRYVGFYMSTLLKCISDWVRFHCYKESVGEMLKMEHAFVPGFQDYLTLALNHGDTTVIDTIREMILGDNNVLLSRDVIQAVLRSTNEELKDLLMKLLLAASRQEGLRQAILESADAGTADTLCKVLQVCNDNDLFRFSSAARALYTWTGLYHEDADIDRARRLGKTALECLQDETKRQAYAESRNPLEVYLSLWALGAKEIMDTRVPVQHLLFDPEKYKRMLGWYFILHTESDVYGHSMAVNHLQEEDDEVLAWVVSCLHYSTQAVFASAYKKNDWEAVPLPDQMYPADRSERYALFEQLKQLVLRIGRKEHTFSPSLFPWVSMTLANADGPVLKCMMSLAAFDLDEQMTDELWELKDYFSADQRRAYYIRLLDPDGNPKHRQYLYEGLSDRSPYNREMSIQKLQACMVQNEDIVRMAGVLNTASASVKKTAVSYLSALEQEQRAYAVKILAEGSEAQIQAALELMIADPALKEDCAEILQELSVKQLSTQTGVLLKRLTGEEKQEYSQENGYGLYDEEQLRREAVPLAEDIPLLKPRELKKLYLSDAEIYEAMDRVNAVFDAHADYEYTWQLYDGTRQTIRFGEPEGIHTGIRIPAEYGADHKLHLNDAVRFDMIPFHEEFHQAMERYIRDPERFAMLAYTLLSRYMPSLDRNILEWYETFRKEWTPGQDLQLTQRYAKRTRMIMEVMLYALQETDGSAVQKRALQVYFSLISIFKEENLMRSWYENRYDPSTRYPALGAPVFSFLRSLVRRVSADDASFAVWFKAEYALECRIGYDRRDTLTLQEYLRAADLKIIPVQALYRWLLATDNITRAFEIGRITDPKDALRKTYPWLKEAADTLADRMIRYEALRGQAETPLSRKVMQIREFEGGEYFCQLLAALGKEKFFRGYSWSADTKNGVLSCMLKRCRPSPEDTADSLKALLKDTDIKEKRLIEAAMYAPQWAPLLEEVTGWKGLTKAVWFFHAHISEHFSSEKETEIALYSPITPQQFNDGAFDPAWFRESYEELGEKRFKVLYDSARYITSGSNAHRRSQLYTDAVTGKLDAGELEKEIAEKRNQDKLRAYALIPLQDEKELLHRYGFIAAYQKQSSQYGAQRRESERKAARSALENLAITSGVYDVNRMLWRLEKARLEEIRPLLEDCPVGDYTAAIVLDEEGSASLKITKDGKALKSVPKAIAKDPGILERKEIIADLKEQRIRSRHTLEESMENRTVFGMPEICNILDAATIAPLVSRLVFVTDDDHTGFVVREGDTLSLKDAKGNSFALPEDASLRIAHPYDLYRINVWADYMHLLVSEKTVQPFKQVFREFYPLTQDEKDERTLSRRYAGYQVQPKKTVALLRTRGWTVDYEEGLQKVSYTDSIVVHLFAQADWFSPADIEAPTLEYVRFTHRRSDEPIPLEDIDPILFSETMRDLDLAVSAAYVGGVDPETSASTVEMRIALAKELLSLMKVNNVSFSGRHAVITGKLAEYSVHMGSGIVHAKEKGMIPILAVPSQHRGRIFLPFADDDPRTAEILSKILLLAEDTKIKDPEILRYLR
ncbi:MAG: DUF4132 domain-containing protein [Solobacterium sp.]|nr:DUF4132 domain-containing protein [Solobacterium sp.]